MKICLLATSTAAHQQGGTEVHASSLAAEAARQGHEVFLVSCAHPGGLKSERRDGYTAIYLAGTSHRMSRPDAPAWWAASAARTAALCDEEKIDVVWAENFAGLAYAAIPRERRRPVISVAQGLAVRGEVASVYGAASGPGDLLRFFTRYAAQTLFYYIPRFRAMVRDSDLLAAVSDETAAALAAEFPSSRAKTRVIYNFTDTALFRPDQGLRAAARAGLGLRDAEPAVMMSGVLHRQKGMHIGLEAFAALAPEFPAARLLVAGDGPERAALERQAAAAGLAGRVLFAGAVPNAEMPALYNAADVYLNPTLRGEGLPLVMAEAMACGLPSVVSRIGGTGSTVEDGASGWFVKPGDTGAMSEKLRGLLGDRDLRSRFGAAARERALARFDRARAAAAFIGASRELAGI